MIELPTDYDVIIVDMVGMPFDSFTPELTGLGGSESEQIYLLEGLAKHGLRVLSINRCCTVTHTRNVLYSPPDISAHPLTCKTLVLERLTPMPVNIKAESIYRWFTDAAEKYPEEGHNDHEQAIFVSNWQRANLKRHDDGWRLDGANTHVIPNMLPDWLYAIAPNRNTPAHSFIYASAAMKGLNETLQYFAEMRKSNEFRNATLKIACPAYSRPAEGPVKVFPGAPGVEYLGALPFPDLIKAYQSCRSLLHVSVFPETFGLAHVMAEVLGLNVFVLQAHGTDALSEVCNSPLITANLDKFNASLNAFGQAPQGFLPIAPKDYRASRIVPQWIDLMGLTRGRCYTMGDNSVEVFPT